MNSLWSILNETRNYPMLHYSHTFSIYTQLVDSEVIKFICVQRHSNVPCFFFHRFLPLNFTFLCDRDIVYYIKVTFYYLVHFSVHRSLRNSLSMVYLWNGDIWKKNQYAAKWNLMLITYECFQIFSWNQFSILLFTLTHFIFIWSLNSMAQNIIPTCYSWKY